MVSGLRSRVVVVSMKPETTCLADGVILEFPPFSFVAFMTTLC